MRKEVILSTLALRAGYGGKPVLQGLEIEVREGEIVAVIGRNGVGKSTLMKSLIGLVPAMSGSIVYRGEAIELLPAHKRARLGMGYVPQGRDVFPRLTVAENIAVGVQPLDHLAGLAGLVRRHAGRRLVEQQQPRLQADRHPYLEPLLLTVAQIAGRLHLINFEVEECQQPVDLVRELHAAVPPLQGDFEVLTDR